MVLMTMGVVMFFMTVMSENNFMSIDECDIVDVFVNWLFILSMNSLAFFFSTMLQLPAKAEPGSKRAKFSNTFKFYTAEVIFE
jgi:hypothetical protein